MPLDSVIDRVDIPSFHRGYAIPSTFGHFVTLLSSTSLSVAKTSDELVCSFSHYRVAVPPSGWANAAHKQGTRILGTLIFEGIFSVLDTLQLIVGRSNHVVTDGKIPISKRYAVLLAELAFQRGFDGYLLNFEFELPHKVDQAHALAAWILLLRAELQAKVGSHAQVVWFDGVIYDGRVRYQNRLNAYNLPFFLASDALFTNYWWEPETQDLMSQYFKNLVSGPNALTSVTPLSATKTLQDIYSGIDVWPDRGQYGNGGFCCYRAVTYTAPLGFSTAIFAPGWTWEWVTENPAQNWDGWWDNERKLWLGPLRPGDIISVPDSPEGPFKPMTAYFKLLPPPDPSIFVFHTSFSPGVGYSWFVEGKKVLDTKDGWTDINKQSSIGDLVWPWPNPSWHGVEREEALPTGSTALDMADGYNGGNTLKLTLVYTGGKSEEDIVVWLPVQSLIVTTQKSFEAHVVYKTTVDDDDGLDTHVYAKLLSNESDNMALTVSEANVSNLPRGWTRQTINISCTSTQNTASVAIGFLVGIKPKDPVAQVTFCFSLGQLAVYPTPPPQSVFVSTPSVTGAKFVCSVADDLAPYFQGTLTWDTASTFPPTNVDVDDKESTTPAWPLYDTPACRFPVFAYFNVYIALLGGSAKADPADAVFVGTTGLDGHANRFYVDQACLPTGWETQAGVRFFVQGVTDRGEVLPWERCATVDYRNAGATEHH